MSKLTRKEKAFKLNQEVGLGLTHLVGKTDQEINDLYEERFEKITKEDFEAFEKVCNRLGITQFYDEDGYDLDDDIEEIKKELGL